MPKIVYLEARGRGAYRSRLRSDTLWGLLCWKMRQLAEALGDQGFDLGKFINAYGKEESAEAFFISSAFPWVERGGKRTHFLPAPIIQAPLFEHAAGVSWKNPAVAKSKLRERKAMEKKRKGWLSWQHFAYQFADGAAPDNARDQIWLKTVAITHNQIDRRRLGTFRAGDSGQLFHMNENYLEWSLSGDSANEVDKHGLYFLLDGADTSRVEGALRLLDTLGVGGDHRTGKGSFKIYVEPDVHQLTKSDHLSQDQFSLPKVDAQSANARLSLSLYHPRNAPSELEVFDAAARQEPRFWQYRLEPRQGRNVHQGQVLQDGKLVFAEGSIFPLVADQAPYPGENWRAGKHRLGHDIYRFGHAFMLNIKLK